MQSAPTQKLKMILGRNPGSRSNRSKNYAVVDLRREKPNKPASAEPISQTAAGTGTAEAVASKRAQSPLIHPETN